MPNERIYASIIDQILDDSAPSYEGMTDAKKNGDDFRAITKEMSGNNKLVTELGGESHHTNSAHGVTSNLEDWQGRSAKVMDDNSVLASALKEVGGESTEGLEKKMMDIDKVKTKIDDMLHLGHAPKKIHAALEKLAELALFNKQQSFDYLNSQAGLKGIAYLEPNHFMPKTGSNGCVSSHEFIKKNGSVNALAVKKISSCDGCKFASKQADGSMRCNEYKLPVVGSAAELEKIVKDASAKFDKKATTKTAMLAMHNKETDAKSQALVSRVETPYTVRTAGDKKVAVEDSFTGAKVASSIQQEGKSLGQVFTEARAKYGSMVAQTAVKQYINGLKKTGSKIDLAKIDCSFLPNKLASANAIMGASKCASCSYRNGMHCGLTGGTLLTFPGMDKMNSKKKASYEPGFDGNSLNAEMGLDSTKQASAGDLEIGVQGFNDVDAGSQMSVGDIE